MSVSRHHFDAFIKFDMRMVLGKSCKPEAIHAGAYWQAGVRKAQMGTRI